MATKLKAGGFMEFVKRQDLKRIWGGFWQLADPKIWIASTVPMFVGETMAICIGKRFNLFWFIVALIAVYLIETGKNAFNEVIDYKSGVDVFVDEKDRTPFSGGKKTIVQGKLTVTEAAAIAVLTTGAACVLGLIIVLFWERSVLWIGLAGVVISVIYSLPPFKLCYRGLGEVAVGFTFGPLIVTGIYLAMTGTIDYRVVIAAVPIGFLIANVLWINQYPDYEADKKGGKFNWVVRLGKKKALKYYALWFILAYVFFIVIAVLFRNPFWLLGFVSVPIAVQCVKTAYKYYDDTQKLTPANAKTIQVYIVTGLAMIVAAITHLL